MKEQYLQVYGINIVLSQGNPPDWILDRAEKLFDVDYSLGIVIFTYGNVIYCKKKITAQHVLEHELVHVKQQVPYRGGPDAWWGRFFSDPIFRVEQEIEAYNIQFKYICSEERSKIVTGEYLNTFAKWLSSKQYGNAISFDDAMIEISRGAIFHHT